MIPADPTPTPETNMHLCPLCGSTMGIDPTTVALATYGLDWEDAIGPNCPAQPFAWCLPDNFRYVDGACIDASDLAWDYALSHCVGPGLVLCKCIACAPFWNSPTCTDPEQAPLFTSGAVS